MKKTNFKQQLYKAIKEIGGGSTVRGITLISLVITVIILLVLSTITITTLKNANLFGNSKEAGEKYKRAKEQEENILNEYNRQIELATTREENQTISSNPTGCVISQMGTKAPSGYLVCDGGIYDVEGQYKNLAEYIKDQFGSYDYFKIGTDVVPDGKFKVPDLRGEFLRGAGNNSHTNIALSVLEGSGASVGEHQEATSHVQITTDGAKHIIYPTNSITMSNYDSKTSMGDSYAGGTSSTHSRGGIYTSRPTNTSVLYCIKY